MSFFGYDNVKHNYGVEERQIPRELILCSVFFFSISFYTFPAARELTFRESCQNNLSYFLCSIFSFVFLSLYRFFFK